MIYVVDIKQEEPSNHNPKNNKMSTLFIILTVRSLATPILQFPAAEHGWFVHP